MRLIITRPEEDATELAEKLARLGHLGIIMPLLQIVPRSLQDWPDTKWQAICVTSANALRNITYPAHLKSVPLYCVGPQSLAQARHDGFTRASAHGPDVHSLAAYMTKHLKPDAGPTLYLSGAETSADLAGKLKSGNFVVHRVIVYDALTKAPEHLADELNAADGVLLYSPRTAQQWLAALADKKLDASHLTHYCLSANVAAKLPKHFRHKIAGSPDETGMLQMLDQVSEAE